MGGREGKAAMITDASVLSHAETRHLAYVLCSFLLSSLSFHSRSPLWTMSNPSTMEDLLAQAEAAHVADPTRAEGIYNQILGTLQPHE